MKKLSIPSKVKTLPLQGWMTIMGNGKYSPTLSECSPAYNRDGYYYDDKSKLCWFEHNDKAWVYDAKMFKYDYANFDSTSSNEEGVTNYPNLEKYIKHFGEMLLNHLLSNKRK